MWPFYQCFHLKVVPGETYQSLRYGIGESALSSVIEFRTFFSHYKKNLKGVYSRPHYFQKKNSKLSSVKNKHVLSNMWIPVFPPQILLSVYV